MARVTAQILKANNANTEKAAKEHENLSAELNKARVQVKGLEETRDSADAHARKAIKDLRALQQELEKANLQAKDTEQARGSANADAKKISTNLGGSTGRTREGRQGQTKGQGIGGTEGAE